MPVRRAKRIRLREGIDDDEGLNAAQPLQNGSFLQYVRSEPFPIYQPLPTARGCARKLRSETPLWSPLATENDPFTPSSQQLAHEAGPAAATRQTS